MRLAKWRLELGMRLRVRVFYLRIIIYMTIFSVFSCLSPSPPQQGEVVYPGWGDGRMGCGDRELHVSPETVCRRALIGAPALLW